MEAEQSRGGTYSSVCFVSYTKVWAQQQCMQVASLLFASEPSYTYYSHTHNINICKALRGNSQVRVNYSPDRVFQAKLLPWEPMVPLIVFAASPAGKQRAERETPVEKQIEFMPALWVWKMKLLPRSLPTADHK